MKFLLLLTPLFLFGNSFQENPYLKQNQVDVINKIKEENYRTMPDSIRTLQQVYLYARDANLKQEIISLYNNNEFETEVKITDRRGKEKIKKIDPELSIRKFNNLKTKTQNTYKYLLFGKSLEIDVSELENVLNSKNKILQPDETYYQLLYQVFHKGVEEAKLNFTNYVGRNFEKRFETNTEIKSMPNFEFNGDIYALGAYLHLDNKELFEEYKKKALYFYQDKNRFDFVLADILEKKERYLEASHFYENIKLESQEHLNKLINIYKLAAEQAQLNNILDVSWVNARKGLILNKKYKDLKLDKNALLELKRILKEVSTPYIQSIVDKKEINQSREIKKETIELLLESVI